MILQLEGKDMDYFVSNILSRMAVKTKEGLLFAQPL
jgi:hypothetical protein